MPADSPRCCSRLSRLADPSLAYSPEPEGTWFAKPRKWREEAVIQLWESGWSMKDVAGLSQLPLTAIAKIIGGRTRSGKHLQCREDDSADNGELEDDGLRSLRLGPPAPAPYEGNEGNEENHGDDFIAGLLCRLKGGKNRLTNTDGVSRK